MFAAVLSSASNAPSRRVRVQTDEAFGGVARDADRHPVHAGAEAVIHRDDLDSAGAVDGGGPGVQGGAVLDEGTAGL